MFQYHFEHLVDAEVTKAVIIRRNHPVAIILEDATKFVLLLFVQHLWPLRLLKSPAMQELELAIILF